MANGYGFDMSFLDAIRNMQVPQVADVSNVPLPKPGIMDTLTSIFEDPNTIRMLGEAGAGLSAGQGFGQAAGTAASLNERRKAAQRAGAKASEQDPDLYKSILQSIADGTFLSDKNDNKAFDSVTVGEDGITAKLKNTPKSPLAGQLTDKPLESDLGSGGLDLRNF
jgi:hypothetical protein